MLSTAPTLIDGTPGRGEGSSSATEIEGIPGSGRALRLLGIVVGPVGVGLGCYQWTRPALSS